MNLMDVLLYQDRNELIRLLEKNDSTLNMNSKRELIEVLYPMLVKSEHVRERFNRLSDDAQKIALILCYDEKMLFSKEELNGFAPNFKEKAFLKLVEELTVNGFLFGYVNRTFLIPIQIKKELIRSIQMKIADHSLILPTFSSEQSEITIVNDVFSFIEYVLEKPLPITKTGIIYKKDFQGIMKHFIYKETLPTDQWRFGYGRRFSQYPDRFSLIYDYCYYKGWLIENEATLMTTKRVEELHEMRLHELMKSIVTYWKKLYRRPFPTVRLLYDILLGSLRVGEGIEEEHLITLLSPFVKEYYFDSKEDIVRKRFLKMLINLDVIKKVEFHHFHGYTVGPSMKFLK